MASLPAWEREKEPPKQRFVTDYRYEELRDLLMGAGWKAGSAQRLFQAVHRGGLKHYNQLPQDQFPNALLDWLAADNLPLDPVASVQTYPSNDGSRKYVFHFKRGDAVEAVLMPSDNRTTLCISAQVGCAMGCTFCATGAMGLGRHLSAGEMVAQVLRMSADHAVLSGRAQPLNVVFMGMGEPLHNLAAVLRTFDILTHRHGLVLSEKDVAVSTSGLVPKIEAMGRHPSRPRLMVSIAATTDANRSAIMPVNRAYNLERLLTTLEQFPLKKRERIMLSYVVIADQNDSPEDAKRLAAMSQRFPSLINLIPMNAHDASPGMDEPEEARLQAFYRHLLDLGAFATIRRSRGRDVAAACGQLIRTAVV